MCDGETQIMYGTFLEVRRLRLGRTTARPLGEVGECVCGVMRALGGWEGR